jgi:thioredoxin-like negative regulator of GroEL
MEIQETTKYITQAEYQLYLSKGIDYEAYKDNLAVDLVSNEDEKIKEYINLNQHRMNRVEKTYQISDELLQVLRELRHNAFWLVITEHWCGDAAQILPVFDKISKASQGKLNLKLVYRDQNPELMDAHLTNHSRAIPKLIQLDNQFNVTGIWGPRPLVAQNLVKLLKSNPETAEIYAQELHLWYARDKQISIDSEIQKLLTKANFQAE